MNIKGKRILLRAIEEHDLDALHRWANDSETQDIIGNIYFPSSLDFHRLWFQNLKNEPLNQRFAIQAPEIGLIGLSSIISIDWRNRHAWHGMMLGDSNIRGKGYGADTVMATMRYAFDELGLERLDGSMIEYNQGSVDFYCGKLGWKEEGRQRNWYFRRGRYWDRIVVGVTRADYSSLVEKTRYWD